MKTTFVSVALVAAAGLMGANAHGGARYLRADADEKNMIGANAATTTTTPPSGHASHPPAHAAATAATPAATPAAAPAPTPGDGPVEIKKVANSAKCLDNTGDIEYKKLAENAWSAGEEED